MRVIWKLLTGAGLARLADHHCPSGRERRCRQPLLGPAGGPLALTPLLDTVQQGGASALLGTALGHLFWREGWRTGRPFCRNLRSWGQGVGISVGNLSLRPTSWISEMLILRKEVIFALTPVSPLSQWGQGKGCPLGSQLCRETDQSESLPEQMPRVLVQPQSGRGLGNSTGCCVHHRALGPGSTAPGPAPEAARARGGSWHLILPRILSLSLTHPTPR